MKSFRIYSVGGTNTQVIRKSERAVFATQEQWKDQQHTYAFGVGTGQLIHFNDYEPFVVLWHEDSDSPIWAAQYSNESDMRESLEQWRSYQRPLQFQTFIRQPSGAYETGPLMNYDPPRP
jgi:hypothetical protein